MERKIYIILICILLFIGCAGTVNRQVPNTVGAKYDGQTMPIRLADGMTTHETIKFYAIDNSYLVGSANCTITRNNNDLRVQGTFQTNGYAKIRNFVRFTYVLTDKDNIIKHIGRVKLVPQYGGGLPPYDINMPWFEGARFTCYYNAY